VSVYKTRTDIGHDDGTQGLYDADCVIAVVGGDDTLDPVVVVDHEVTHITLSKQSSLGMLRHALASTRWLARASPHGSDFDFLDATVSPLLVQLHGLEEQVHEAVAWLGTELQTRGQEDLAAPAPYRAPVERMWGLLKAAPGAPRHEGASAIDRVMTVTEALGVAALSPPAVRDVLAERSFRLVSSGAFSQPPNDPTTRLEQLCSGLAGTSFGALEQWAEAVLRQSRQEHAPSSLPEVAGRAGSDLPPVVLRGTLEPEVEAVCGLIRSAMEGSFAPDLPDERLASHWDWFVNWFVFSNRFDRYAQVHVIPPMGLQGRHEYPVYTGDDPPPQLLSGFALGVTRAARTTVDDLSWSKGHSQHGVALFGLNEDIRDKVSWETDLGRSRAFLELYAPYAPVVVNGIGYDSRRGDFDAFSLVADIPHVVLTIRDFKTFWLGHAVNGDGLFGSRTIEWMPMPSPSNPRSPFGFLVLKGQGALFPIYVMPCLVNQHQRIVSVAERVPSPHGVQLREVPGDPYGWLGPMGGAVVAAGRAWEAQWSGTGP
jgi:hypothetical protein